MPPKSLDPNLSLQAFTDLKKIAIEEYGEGISDEEINEMGVRLLRLFSILTTKSPKESEPVRQKPTPEQFKALKYIHHCIYHDQKLPTVRGIAEAIGFKSSRSGLRMLNTLLAQGFISRNQKGTIRMREDVAGCDTHL